MAAIACGTTPFPQTIIYLSMHNKSVLGVFDDMERAMQYTDDFAKQHGDVEDTDWNGAVWRKGENTYSCVGHVLNNGYK